ncbi:general odorant-binding protein 71 isoform X2 [Contarinia nasturtii]|nr:general odorant-binding protein 71 isoform X2 [Contarinia nasturtii]
MHKVGEKDTDSDYSDEEGSDSEYSYESSSNKPMNRPNFNRPNYQNNMQNYPFAIPNTNMYNNNNNNNNNWNSPNNMAMGNNIAMEHNQFRNPHQNQSPGYSNSYNSNKTNSNNNQTEQDRSCLVHCFFRELKMTNNEDFPEKRKMLQVLTKDIREQEVREFYVSSIQECFHVVDNMENYNRRKNKCEVALTIVTCLTERAKTNCEDFHNGMVLF